MRRVLLCALVCVAAAACGKKGPPQPPFPRVPAQVANVVTASIGDDVYVSFAVPDKNVDGHTPADISAIEVYAVTAEYPPETEAQRKVATLVGTVPVRPIMPDVPPLPDGTPAIPLPPGVTRGTTAVVRERITEEMKVAVTLPPKPGKVAPPPVIPEPYEDQMPVLPPLVAPAPTEPPHRYYFLVAVSPRGKKAVPSAPVPSLLIQPSAAPSAPVITYTEKSFTLTWTPSPEARDATLVAVLPVVPVVPVPVAPVVPVAAGEPVVPVNATPVKIVPPLLPAKSVGFNTQATTYNVFEIKTATADEDPFAIKLPPALTAAPIADAKFTLSGVTFGVERCFAVRAIDTNFGAVSQGALSAKTCVTPVDTFPPAPPKSLGAIAGAGVINLIWEPNSEPDLIGYIVLRGDAAGGTLQAITPAPVKETTYRDTTVRPGVRYVYAVVAVDSAQPQNVSGQSNRAEETARQ